MLEGEYPECRICLFNGNGTKLATFEFTEQELKIDLFGFETGIYILEIIDLNARQVEALRFMKE